MNIAKTKKDEEIIGFQRKDTYRSDGIVLYDNTIAHIFTAFQVNYLHGEQTKVKYGLLMMCRRSFTDWEPARASKGQNETARGKYLSSRLLRSNISG